MAPTHCAIDADSEVSVRLDKFDMIIRRITNLCTMFIFDDVDRRPMKAHCVNIQRMMKCDR